MAGTKQGGLKLRETMIKKHGSYEKYLEYMKTVASRGGKNGTGHEFGHGKLDPREMGRKGGLRKGKKNA